MIHQLLHLTRPLFVIDTETTGVDTARDRIVEIGFQRWEAEGMTKEWRTLVDPGVPIPAEVSKIHGITNGAFLRCRQCGRERVDHPFNGQDGLPGKAPGPCSGFLPWPKFANLAANLAKGLSGCDFAGKNVRFDLRIIAAEMARGGAEWSYLEARIIDAERLEQLAVPRTLSHLHAKYTGAVHDGAHGALSDVRASATVIVKQLEAHEQLPRDLDALHALQWPGWIDGDGKFRFVDGVARFGQWGKFAGKPMNSPEASKPDRNGQTYWDWILTAEFSADVKALARQAKLGKFPVAK